VLCKGAEKAAEHCALRLPGFEGAVAKLVGIEGGIVSEVINLEYNRPTTTARFKDEGARAGEGEISGNAPLPN